MSWRGSAPATCWARAEAANVVPTEAETPSEAVFLATHSSIPLFQRDVVTDPKRKTKTNEQALLEALNDQPADQPILPILGGSGTGKSHLVRWLRAELPEVDSRRIIFVPKHRMSLRGILELILEHAGSDGADELRQKVATAVEGLTDEHEAKLRLRSELAVLVETRGTRSDVSSEEQQYRYYLASSEGLPALLSDPVFRDRLFDENSPISRLVHEKLAGKGTEDKEEAFGFTAGDLAMSVDDTRRASKAAETVAGALASDVEARTIAAKMLNEQLDPAVSQVFGIGGSDLKDLLVEVRTELKRDGLNLLLLIEDFSIFQGIQGGLLDAITLIPTQDNDICPMRVVMAVTTGYFMKHMPDTVYTRVYKVFDLEAPNPQVSFEPAALAARYLNAIRVGNQRLDQAHAAKEETPNACEQCPVNDKCHAAFGAVDGYGLFPFNRNALKKAVKSKLVDERLSVRDFLTRVLRPVMFNHHDNIDQGTFPNAEFDAAFRAGAVGTLDSVEDEHLLATPGDDDLSRRRVIMVRYWGSEGTEPRNLRSTIHEAFEVPPLKGLRGKATVDDEPASASTSGTTHNTPTPVTPPQKEPRHTASRPPLVQAIDDWRPTGLLRQGHRNDLRNLIHTAITARLALDDGCGGSPMWTDTSKQWDAAFDAKASIKIGDQAVPCPLITIDKDDTTSVRALRALAWVNETEEWGSVENGEELQPLLEEQVAAWATTVSDALISHRDSRDDPELAVAANTLLAMSKALGVPDAFKDDALSRARALFAPAPLTPDAPRPRLRQWQKRVSEDSQRLSRAQLQGRVLRLASFTQATGSPLALDLPRVTKAVRGKESGSDLPPATGLLGDTVNAVRALEGLLPTVRDEASALVPDLSDLGGELPELVKQLENLVTERANAGQLPSVINRSELTTAGKAIKPGDQNRVEGVRAKIDAWDQLSVDDRIRLLTDDWDEPAGRVRHWLGLATRAIQALEARLGDGGTSAAQIEYDQTRSALVASLKGLVALLDTTPQSTETA